MTLLAPAKLNLHLELLRRRVDGYHDLETVMLAIDLCDEVQVSMRNDERIVFHCGWLPSEQGWRHRLGAAADEGAVGLPASGQNLARRAAELFLQRFGVTGGVEVTIRKRIPMGAGLGGASADAAGVLHGMASLFDVEPGGRELFELAGELGSDVPFLLAAASGHGTACIARGRGERLEFIEVRRDLNFVILYPPHPLSTREVYSGSKVPAEPRGSETMVEILTGKVGPWRGLPTFNRLQAPAEALQPYVSRALEALRRAGARAVAVTGSGSACFGICQTTAHAQRIARGLTASGMGLAIATRPWSVHQRRQEMVV